MQRVPSVLDSYVTYVCFTAADHIRILVCTLSYHKKLMSQDDSGWKGDHIVQTSVQTRVTYEVKSGYLEFSQED